MPIDQQMDEAGNEAEKFNSSFRTFAVRVTFIGSLVNDG